MLQRFRRPHPDRSAQLDPAQSQPPDYEDSEQPDGPHDPRNLSRTVHRQDHDNYGHGHQQTQRASVCRHRPRSPLPQGNKKDGPHYSQSHQEAYDRLELLRSLCRVLDIEAEKKEEVNHGVDTEPHQASRQHPGHPIKHIERSEGKTGSSIAAGLPFAPFDVFDWMARVLPGSLVRFGIDTMVNLLLLLGLNVKDTAKTAEQLQAIVGFLVTLGVVGTVFLVALRERRSRAVPAYGGALGLLVAVPIIVVVLSVYGTAKVSRVVGTVWLLGVFIVWGLGLGWVQLRTSVRMR